MTPIWMLCAGGKGMRLFRSSCRPVEHGTPHGNHSQSVGEEEWRRFTRNEVRPLVADLDQLPFYDRSLYKSYDLYTRPGYDLLYHQVIMTGRGCPKTCTFCFNKDLQCPLPDEGAGHAATVCSPCHPGTEAAASNPMPRRSITIDDDSFTLAAKEMA